MPSCPDQRALSGRFTGLFSVFGFYQCYREVLWSVDFFLLFLTPAGERGFYSTGSFLPAVCWALSPPWLPRPPCLWRGQRLPLPLPAVCTVPLSSPVCPCSHCMFLFWNFFLVLFLICQVLFSLSLFKNNFHFSARSPDRILFPFIKRSPRRSG